MTLHLFVGIGGGIPRNPSPDDPEEDIHLGDVVIGWAGQAGVPAVVQYDFRKAEEGSSGRLLGTLDKPDRRLLNALGTLTANHFEGETNFVEHLNRIDKFSHPGLENDVLYEATYRHEAGNTCSGCDFNHAVDRPKRNTKDLIFHQGTILSGDSVIKDAKLRDELAEKYYGAICVEMEAAGIMDEKHCLVIRGISDYADSHKNHSWQPYAAATAAAFARELLYTIEPKAPDTSKSSPKKILFKVPLERDRNFTARDHILAAIDKKFSSEHRVALTGIGGVGKSHIALEYCYRFREKHPQGSVIWVYSGTATRFQQEYRDIAMRLDLPGWGHKSFEEILPLVRAWLAGNVNTDWLMIIDNADAEGDIPTEVAEGTNRPLSEYIPYSPRGKVLITCSNKRVADMMVDREDQIIKVEPLETADAHILLRKKLPEGTNAGEISNLVTLLHGIPLAITQSAAYIKEVLTERKKILGKQHQDTLISLNDLGQTLRNQGKYKEATAMYKKALNGREKLLGLDNQDTLASMSNLANVLSDQGDYTAAEEMLRTVIRRKEAQLTREHPSTLATKEHLAETLAAQGKYQEAENLHYEVINLSISVLGEKHPDTLWSINGLATMLLAQERLKDAEQKFQETLKLCKEIMGPDNSHTLTIMINLGYTLETQEKYLEAENLYFDALDKMEGMKKQSGEAHRYMRLCMEGLANSLRCQGKNGDANEIDRKIKVFDTSATPKVRRLTGFANKLFL
ncbi:Nephrocystin-3 [Dactylellina cionopaga]|nr:Nephrocystin-3 [Dactylellina cionopaga]